MKLFKSLLVAPLFYMSFASSATDKLTVYAASSMTNAVTEIVSAFEQEQDVDVTTVFAGSSSLARQLAHGAPADVFISANTKWVQYLIEQGVVSSDNVTNIASNRLVIISGENDQKSFELNDPKSWAHGLNGSRLAIGQPDAVPAGIYAKESLKNLGIWPSVKDHLAPTNNVRIALALVERKEASLGVVYRTDAQLSNKVNVLGILPESTHQPIIYPMAQLNERPVTKAFSTFTQQEKSKEILAKFGFN
ncbi:molybdate ABC transporter substrate-binding protein [Vibrio japonicus]|uniref:Molybdate ABC transporter substrate-binding protein n=1 Tax=Vibrio japonicus TaxID=1824638 RepID=A0ABY5LKC3_9VIBR|nr:molybdate ABC transporter substrate-binding protein [Vibrio japonicus]UUM32544.1 molybdate ABC transporter substrate-binding protein [Vibrio japonicus]